MAFHYTRPILTFIGLMTLSICIPFIAHAEINIAVVDIEKVLSETKAAKSVQKQIEEKRNEFLGEVKKAEDKLRVEQKAIENKKSELNKEQFIKKAQEFDKQRADARNKIQKNKADLDKDYAEAMNKLTKVIYVASQEIANEDKIDLVITRQNIIVGDMSLDITKKVIERINKKLPKLSL